MQHGADANVRKERNVRASESLPAPTANVKTEIWKVKTGGRVESSPCIGENGKLFSNKLEII